MDKKALLKEYVAITLGTLIGAAAVYFFIDTQSCDRRKYVRTSGCAC